MCLLGKVERVLWGNWIDIESMGNWFSLWPLLRTSLTWLSSMPLQYSACHQYEHTLIMSHTLILDITKKLLESDINSLLCTSSCCTIAPCHALLIILPYQSAVIMGPTKDLKGRLFKKTNIRFKY